MHEITAPDGYEIAEDVTFTLKDTMEVQKVEMKDARTPEKTTEKTNAPKTGDNQKYGDLSCLHWHLPEQLQG